jgi:exopolyphosphatase/pppGpp-phosphohydrolase
LLESLGLSGALSKSGLKRCRASAASFVQQRIIPTIGQTRFEGGPFNAMRLVGTGKKLRALASASKSPKQTHPNNGLVSITSKGLTSIIDGLWRMNRRERAAMLSISESDADVVLTAAVTQEAVLKRFDFDVLHASRGSLRQGAILKAFADRREAAMRRHD